MSAAEEESDKSRHNSELQIHMHNIQILHRNSHNSRNSPEDSGLDGCG